MKKIEIIGVPSDLGCHIRGANLGPSAIRMTEIHKKIRRLGYVVNDRGDIAIPIKDSLPQSSHDEQYRHEIITTCQALKTQVMDIYKQGGLPICLGGDHSLAMGSLAGASEFYRQQGKKLGVIWVDAHADMNTIKSSYSGNIHGMPLAALLGIEKNGFKEIFSEEYAPTINPKDTFLLGIRNLDDKEKEFCKNSGVSYYTMRDIDEQGMPKIIQNMLDTLLSKVDGIYVSFDLDAIDPVTAPGVSTPVTGGISSREAHLFMENINDSGKLAGIDIVELNPVKDNHLQTATLSTDLILSALGQSILGKAL